VPFHLTIDEHGNVMPCCTQEAWIGKLEPFANIYEHDFEEIIKRALYYHQVIRRFFYDSVPAPKSCELCANKDEGMNEFLTKPVKLLYT